MRKILIILFITLLSMSKLFSQENNENNLSHYIGGAAGFSTGYGLSYRFWPGYYGTQIVFTPVFDGTDTTINLGTAIVKAMHDTTYTRLFLFLAANGTYSNYEESIYTDKEPFELIDAKKEEALDFVIGIGPGLEIYIFKNIVLDIMFGFKYGISGFNSGLGFTAETALYYRF